MRRSSPQGLQVLRRECGHGAAPKENMGSVWEVVTALATALTDARDQLVTLLQNSTVPPRMTGGCARDTTPARSRSHSPHQTWLPNLHPPHGHSHNEYRLHPTPVRMRPPGPAFRPKPPPEPVRPPPRRCTHPLHNMLHARKSVPACPPHVGAERSTWVARSSGKHRINAASYDQKQRCIGSQCAALLRDETYRVRDRRLADDNSRRPPWKSR